MSFPSFPPSPPMSSPPPSSPSQGGAVTLEPSSPGAGNLLPQPLLIVCGVCAAAATAISIFSITLQLKQYRRPVLQRAVVRIMLMVPLYAISSLIALFSLDAAFFIDAVRDLYEAFVIYTFLSLLITYLGGERSLLILLHGRPPIPHPFPVSMFVREMDVSDPWVLLGLKRGVLQYVQIKPLLVIVTIILKATNTYREGAIRPDAGYAYVSLVYNVSICLSLYCLAMFWVCVNQDLKPFRPVPKFLCVKGILFFSFWQSILISVLVAVGAIKRLGAYTDPEHMSLGLTDALVCLEMPFFAIAHQYAFQASDYIDHSLKHAARMPFYYALRDAFGLRDVWLDSIATFRGRGVSYQAYEPAEGGLHFGEGRQKRIRAGLRYSKGGKAKYWLPVPGDDARARGETGPLVRVKRGLQERRNYTQGYAPLTAGQANSVISSDPRGDFSSDSDESDAPSLTFHDERRDDWEENMYKRARKVEWGVGYPNVDVSREEKRKKLWEEEEGVLKGKWMRGAFVPTADATPVDGGEGTVSNGYSVVGRAEGAREGLTKAQIERRERLKNKGKGKEDPKKGKFGVYGAWANEANPAGSSTSTPTSTSPPEANHASTSSDKLDSIIVDHGAVKEAWLFDGENEREDLVSADLGRKSSKGKGGGKGEDQDEGTRLHWSNKGKETRLNGRAPPQSASGTVSPQPPKSPFEIGDADDVSDPDLDKPIQPSNRPLPSDAVDLIVEDPAAVERAQELERRKGEPATHAPTHVFKRAYGVGEDVSAIGGPEFEGVEVARRGSEEQSGGTSRVRGPGMKFGLEEEVEGNPWG